jgi:hypothetical protein
LPIHLLAAFAIGASAPCQAADAPADAVRVQVVLRDTHKELNVYHYSKGSKAGEFWVPFFMWGNLVKHEARDGKLTAAVGDYAHGDTLAAAFAKVLPAKYPVFAVATVIEGADAAADSQLVQAAQGGGFHYVLLVDEEFSGISGGTYTSDNDQVSVAERVRFEVFDVASGKRLHKSQAVAFGLARTGLAAAVTDGAFYRTHYPAVAEATAAFVVGDLLRTDKLHEMAAAHGHGEQVPALAKVLAKYDDPVVIKPKPPKGWQVATLGTPYALGVEPKSEARYKLGLRFDVDLLVPEFGQDVATIDEYLTSVALRLTDAGYDAGRLEPLAPGVLVFPPDYVAYRVPRMDGTGGQLMGFKLLEKPYVAVLTVVATEDLDGHVQRHRADIEQAFADVRIAIDPDEKKRR